MNYEHLDLFSGIGGFALAAQEAGFRTVAFCESDTRCRAFLGKRWGLPVEPDVNTLLIKCREFVHTVGNERFLRVIPDASLATPSLSSNGEMQTGSDTKQRSGTDQEPHDCASSLITEESAPAAESEFQNFLRWIINSTTETPSGRYIRNSKLGESHSSADCQTNTKCSALTAITLSQSTEYVPIKISLLTAGVPCQSASRAGKQGGERDNRWLWPQALSCLELFKPDSVVFENPLGIGDVGLDGILSEMGRLGYEVQCFDIPACAVDSPQLRHRYWIVGFASGERSERERDSRIVAGPRSKIEREAQERERRGDAARDSSENSSVADANRERRESTSQLDCQQIEPEQPASRRLDANGCNLSVADARCERSGQDEPGRGSDSRAVDRRDSANDLADTAEPGHEERGVQPGISSRERCADARQTADMGAQSLVADTEEQHRPIDRREASEHRRSHWSNSVWVPCADGKLRRAPDDSFMLVDGVFSEVSGIVGSRPHRSLLGALGNSIVWQVAVEILRAVRMTL